MSARVISRGLVIVAFVIPLNQAQAQSFSAFRYDDDVTAFGDAAMRMSLYDHLKYIPLGDSPADYVSFGGDERERVEAVGNALLWIINIPPLTWRSVYVPVMLMPIALPAPGLARTFSLIIDGLCRTTAARSAVDRFAGPMLILIFARLRRLASRFASLGASVEARMIQAGPLPPTRPSRPAAGATQRTSRKTRLPQSFAWLIRLVPGTAAYAGQVQALVADPQTAALLAAAPQAGRILRPLCRMLAVPLPDYLRLPKPPSGPQSAPKPTGADTAVPPPESSSSESPARPTPPLCPAGVTPRRAAAAAIGPPPLLARATAPLQKLPRAAALVPPTRTSARACCETGVPPGRRGSPRIPRRRRNPSRPGT